MCLERSVAVVQHLIASKWIQVQSQVYLQHVGSSEPVVPSVVSVGTSEEPLFLQGAPIWKELSSLLFEAR